MPITTSRRPTAACGGPGGATPVRPMAVESVRSVPRAANPFQAGMEATRVNETVIRAVAVFVARAV